jgi:N-dimethylarginine dimethylaminohydrolase
MQLKQKNSGKWWVKGQEHNDAFTEFVEQWLTNWVGYVEETNFDINVLMLDDKHCCISNINNENQKEFAKKHNIELIHVPWRHRYFWDGGLHCITLDLFREGSQKDYGI